MSLQINVALIGYAFMGRAHSNAYRQVSAFFTPTLTPRMKVLCGRTRANVEAAARQYGWEEASTDWREVIARPDIQLVDVSTSGDSHAEIAIAAAEAGKAVICEKPLARTLDEAERMLAAVRRAGVTNMICHNYRRAPAVMLAHELIAAGTLGTIRHFRGTYLQEWLVDPARPRTWRLDRSKAGAGTLGDIGSHVIDLARFLVGEITDVTGALNTFIRRPLPDDPSTRRRSRSTTRRWRSPGSRTALGTIEARYALGRKNPTASRSTEPRSIAFNLERINELDLSRLRSAGRPRLPDDSRHRPAHPASRRGGRPATSSAGNTRSPHGLRSARSDAAGCRVAEFRGRVANQRVMDAIERAAAQNLDHPMKIGVFAVLFGDKPFGERSIT